MMGELILTLVYGISKLPDGETHMGLAERALGGILYTFTREFQVACVVNRISRRSRFRYNVSVSKLISMSGILPLPEFLFPIKKTSRMYREDVESQTEIPFQETKRQMVSLLSSLITDCSHRHEPTRGLTMFPFLS